VDFFLFHELAFHTETTCHLLLVRNLCRSFVLVELSTYFMSLYSSFPVLFFRFLWPWVHKREFYKGVLNSNDEGAFKIKIEEDNFI
jgi:hypothetical protein